MSLKKQIISMLKTRVIIFFYNKFCTQTSSQFSLSKSGARQKTPKQKSCLPNLVVVVFVVSVLRKHVHGVSSCLIKDVDP